MNLTNKNIIQKGYASMEESSVLICSIIRDSNKLLKRNIPRIENLRRCFKYSKVVVFENDSVDGTKSTLKKWEDNSNNVFVTCENFNTITIPTSKTDNVNKYFSYHRISKMTNYRNRYMDFLKKDKTSFDFVIVIDLDIENFCIDGIAHSLGVENEWDVITANGYSYSPMLRRRYHDTYALVEVGYENISQSEKMIYNAQKKWSFLRPDFPLIPVYSAYGGLAIYQYSVLNNKKYETLFNKDEKVEVRCEHFSLHDQIYREGNNRIFINPSMEVTYQSFNFKILRNFVISFFNK